MTHFFMASIWYPTWHNSVMNFICVCVGVCVFVFVCVISAEGLGEDSSVYIWGAVSARDLSRDSGLCPANRIECYMVPQAM